MKRFVLCVERYPVFELDDTDMMGQQKCVQLSQMEIDDYEKMARDYTRWQEKLKKLYNLD